MSDAKHTSNIDGSPVPVRAVDVRRHNLALVIQQVASRRQVTRAELARATQLTKGTISTLVGELLDLEIIAEVEVPRPKRVGRPPSGAITLNGSLYCGVGVEINVDYIAVCVSDLLHRVRFHEITPVDNRQLEPRDVLNSAAKMVRAATQTVAAEGLVPAGVALAVPGVVDAARRRLVRAPNLGWTDVALVTEFRRRLGPLRTPVYVDNEANLAALGELWVGAGAGFGDYIFISGEIGVGGAIVVGRELFRGAHGFAGEIGHVVVDPGGPLCACGRRGCLERVAGQEGLLRAAGIDGAVATTLGAERAGSQLLIRRLQAGDRRAVDAVTAAARPLALALTDLANILDPDSIILGGIYGQIASWLTEPLEQELDAKTLGTNGRSVVVRPSTLGPEAAVRGAAALVTERVLAAPGAFPD